MDPPSTVKTALADRPVAGAVCLEAGAGVGNTTAGLLADGASRVYAITNHPGDARAVRERAVPGTPRRVALVTADLRDIPLREGSVDLVTAHGLCNVLTPAALEAIANELTRVAAPGAHLVVDDYEPLPGDAEVRDLFAIENAVAELARNESALSFYPPDLLRWLFEGRGWRFERERTLLDPVPWTEAHVRAHADVVREAVDSLPEGLREPMYRYVERVAERIESESAGRMYSLAFRLST